MTREEEDFFLRQLDPEIVGLAHKIRFSRYYLSFYHSYLDTDDFIQMGRLGALIAMRTGKIPEKVHNHCMKVAWAMMLRPLVRTKSIASIPSEEMEERAFRGPKSQRNFEWLYEAVRQLPPKQKASICSSFRLSLDGELPPDKGKGMDSLRGNYTHAIRSLRRLLPAGVP